MLSAIIFALVFIILIIRQKTIPFYILLIAMFSAFLFDGSFTIWPKLHNTPINDPHMGFVKYLFILYFIIFIGLMIFMTYKGD